MDNKIRLCICLLASKCRGGGGGHWIRLASRWIFSSIVARKFGKDKHPSWDSDADNVSFNCLWTQVSKYQ